MIKIVIYFMIMMWFTLSVYAQEWSIGVYGNITIEKESGAWNSIFVHENHSVNPFSSYQIIREMDGEIVLSYRVWGQVFNEEHSLFISYDDEDVKKTISGWNEKQAGIYVTTILQEDTYELINGIYTPKQTVAATSYYRIEYNHDNTPPVCEENYTSRDIAGNNSFLLGENIWSSEERYGYFLCWDSESWCLCEPDDTTCFIYEERVFSIPQIIWHKAEIQSDFLNTVWLTTTCNFSSTSVLYDYISPEFGLKINNSEIDTSNIREYITNEWILYDGEQISSKKYYNITEKYNFKASDQIDIDFTIIDPYLASLGDQGVSGIESYTIIVSKKIDDIWMQVGNKEEKLSSYNVQGNTTSSDVKSILSTDIDFLENTFTKVGEYQLYVEFKDAAHNSGRVIMHYEIVPGQLSADMSFVRVDTTSSKYANGIDAYNYSLYLRDSFSNPIYNKQVYNLKHDCSIAPNCQEIYQYMDGGSGSGDIVSEIYNIWEISNENGIIWFKARSLAPWELSETFSFEMFDWDEAYENIFSSPLQVNIQGDNNVFLAPFSWVLEWEEAWNWWRYLTQWQQQEFRLRISEDSTLSFDGNIQDFSTEISWYDSNSVFTLSWALEYIGNNNVYFNGSLNSSLVVNDYDKLGIKLSSNDISDIWISYVLEWKLIKYNLTQAWYGTTPITLMKNIWALSEPVKIIWNLQWVWNENNISERQNFSDVSSSLMRNALRKNILSFTRSMNHEQIIDWVKFIDASQLVDNVYDLEVNPNFETLVVKNGNIHISNDFNTSSDIVWLVVYQDTGYDIELWYKGYGNIYIDNSVGEINAFIYADGALISSENKAPIVEDVISRWQKLWNQLYIKWALFTRNTFWWSTIQKSQYTLPWLQYTLDQSLAVQYDLYHLRRGNDNCKESFGSCVYPEYTIIEYDSRIQSNPPKLFSQ